MFYYNSEVCGKEDTMYDNEIIEWNNIQPKQSHFQRNSFQLIAGTVLLAKICIEQDLCSQV